jgi:hypothetical protein
MIIIYLNLNGWEGFFGEFLDSGCTPPLPKNFQITVMVISPEVTPSYTKFVTSGSVSDHSLVLLSILLLYILRSYSLLGCPSDACQK